MHKSSFTGVWFFSWFLKLFGTYLFGIQPMVVRLSSPYRDSPIGQFITLLQFTMNLSFFSQWYPYRFALSLRSWWHPLKNDKLYKHTTWKKKKARWMWLQAVRWLLQGSFYFHFSFLFSPSLPLTNGPSLSTTGSWIIRGYGVSMSLQPLFLLFSASFPIVQLPFSVTVVNTQCLVKRLITTNHHRAACVSPISNSFWKKTTSESKNRREKKENEGKGFLHCLSGAAIYTHPRRCIDIFVR